MKEEVYISVCLDSNRVSIPSGDFKVVWFNSIDYKKEGKKNIYTSSSNFSSTTKVRVRGGLVDLETLILATKEILEQNGYWGRYLEGVDYNSDKECLEVFIGS